MRFSPQYEAFVTLPFTLPAPAVRPRSKFFRANVAVESNSPMPLSPLTCGALEKRS
jgi:hypothetical protein